MDVYNSMCDLEDFLKSVEYMLFNGGLDYTYINEIKDAIKRVYYIDFFIKQKIQGLIISNKKSGEFNDQIKYQKYLLRCVGDIGVRLVRILKELRICVGDYSLTDFIKDNSSLLHLTSTNNHSNQRIRKVSDDSYFYICPFHVERKSSMMVKNNKNRLYCFGCGANLNVFEYLSQFEGISYKDAVMLLARINKIEVSNNRYQESDDIVRKYTNSGSLKRYEKRVVSGRKRASYKNKTLNNLLAMEKFEEELDTINRIRNNQYISYSNGGNKKRVLRKEVQGW